MSDEAVHTPLFPGKSNAGPNCDRVLRELAKTGVTLKFPHMEDRTESYFSYRRYSSIEPMLA